jgi:hypothetical protein
MSNRLGYAHTAPRREPREWMPAPAPRHGIAATALRWLREAMASHAIDLPAAMQRDLGLPETGPDAVVFGYEIERSRVRV